MYSPFFVLPYQRSPCRWYTFESLFTHTRSLPLTSLPADALLDIALLVPDFELLSALEDVVPVVPLALFPVSVVPASADFLPFCFLVLVVVVVVVEL